MPRRWVGVVGRGASVTLRDGGFPKPIEAISAALSGVTTITIAIGRTDLTPANFWNIVLVVSDVAPNVPSGWTLTFTTDPTPGGVRVYALERAADTTVDVTVTFPSAATGGVMSLFIDDTTVIAEGTTGGLGGVTSTNIDVDRVDPDEPTTMVVGMLFVSINGGTMDTDPSWDWTIGAGSAAGRAQVWQYEGEPPATDWVEHTGGIIATMQMYAWFYFELGSP